MSKLSVQRLFVVCAVAAGFAQPVCSQTGGVTSAPSAVSPNLAPAVVPALVPATTAGTVGGGLSPLAERSRIDQERASVETVFLESQAVCYQKFAVEGCQVKARGVRREALADLRRQEVTLNATQARLQGAAQLSRVDSKSSTQAESDRATQRAVAEEKQQARQTSADEKSATRAAAEKQAVTSALDGTVTRTEKKAQTQDDPTAKVKAAALAQKTYDERLKQAQLKAEKRRKRLLE